MSKAHLPDKVWVAVSGKHKTKLHADEDCHALINSDAREVDRSLYPNANPCQLCTDYGNDPIEKCKKGGSAEGYKKLLNQADTLDDVREAVK